MASFRAGKFNKEATDEGLAKPSSRKALFVQPVPRIAPRTRVVRVWTIAAAMTAEPRPIRCCVVRTPVAIAASMPARTVSAACGIDCLDTDADSFPDAMDSNDDNDNVPDDQDAFPLDPHVAMAWLTETRRHHCSDRHA